MPRAARANPDKIPPPVPALSFRMDLPHGRCVALAIPEEGVTPGLLAGLDPEEVSFLSGLPSGRQSSFAAGRAALRAAIADLGLPLAPILPDERGAPRLPAGVLGSISHKWRLAVALAAPIDERRDCALGVDLEEERAFRFDISRRVLTSDELADIAPFTEPERTRAVLSRFCLKEAFYKAANGFVGRTIGFHEVAVTAIEADGRARFSGDLLSDPAPLIAQGWVGQPHPGYILASVAACRRG
jgi:4'-phosphopantetheinyl transferase EntD